MDYKNRGSSRGLRKWKIETFPKGDECQCARCRAERGDTQFSEFMQKADAFIESVEKGRSED